MLSYKYVIEVDFLNQNDVFFKFKSSVRRRGGANVPLFYFFNVSQKRKRKKKKFLEFKCECIKCWLRDY